MYQCTHIHVCTHHIHVETLELSMELNDKVSSVYASSITTSSSSCTLTPEAATGEFGAEVALIPAALM